MIDQQQIFLIVSKNLMKKVFLFILLFLVPTSLQAQFKLLLSIGMRIINPQVKFLRYAHYPLGLRRINVKEIFIINNTITAKEINMNISKNTLLIIALVITVVLFLYFGSGAIMDGGMHGRMNENSWVGGSIWRWFPTIVFLLVGVLIGWLLFRKKN